VKPLEQEIRFARSSDGARIAFATMGAGYPLVNAAHWLGHLEFDWQTAVWLPWMERLSSRYRLTRYDSRGCGLSDRNVASFSLDDLVADLEAVVDAAGIERFALLGKSQGGAISIAYAAKHPERVSHIVLCGAFARGALRRDPSARQRSAIEAMAQLVELGWGHPNSAFLQMFTSLFFPQATPEQMRAFNMIQRKATSPRHAARILRALAELDAAPYLARVTCPTLVIHCRGDAVSPFEEGRFLAASIAGARLEPLDSRNHVPLAGEPSFDRMFDLLSEFLPGTPIVGSVFGELTQREREMLDLIARGRDNAQIAAHLELAEKTVRNRITQIFTKIAVENRAQAIVRAREAGFGR
jgi:pimeloyl-ACP methyl ester carboxylesterase/DNA-binding CsgD family transcriptional regulator